MSSATNDTNINNTETIKDAPVEKVINKEVDSEAVSSESNKVKADEVSTKHPEQGSKVEAEKEKAVEIKETNNLDNSVEAKETVEPVKDIESKAVDTKVEPTVASEETSEHVDAQEKEEKKLDDVKSTEEIKPTDEAKSSKEEKAVEEIKSAKVEEPVEEVETLKEEKPVDEVKIVKEEKPAEKAEVTKEESPVEKAESEKKEAATDEAKSENEVKTVEEIKSEKVEDAAELELEQEQDTVSSTIAQENTQEKDPKKDEDSKVESVESIKPVEAVIEVLQAVETKKAPVEPVKDRATSLLDDLEAELSSLNLTEAEAKELAAEGSEEEGDYPLIELFASSVSGNRTIKSHIRKIEDAFESHDIEYTYMDTASDEQAKLYLRRKSPHQGVLPQIFVDGRFKCLYEEFAHVLETGDLYDYFEIDPEA